MILTLAVARAASTLEELFESEREEVWFVLITVLTAESAVSTLEDELDIELELALIANRVPSTLDEDWVRRRLEF